MKSESGNVFFYILLAIILFAALSYAVSQGNRGNTSILTDQQAKLVGQEIIEYGQTIANAVQKLKLRGCGEEEISFENNIEADYINANAPVDKSCHVFDGAGGAANYNNNLGAWLITGNLKIQDLGSSSTNLILLLPSLQQSVCKSLNNALSVADPSTTDIYAGTVSKFDGGASAYIAATTPIIGDSATDYAGLTSFCFQKGANDYEFIQVLLTR